MSERNRKRKRERKRGREKEGERERTALTSRYFYSECILRLPTKNVESTPIFLKNVFKKFTINHP